MGNLKKIEDPRLVRYYGGLVITSSGDWKAKIENIVKKFAESDGTNIVMVELSEALYLKIHDIMLLHILEEKYNVTTILAEPNKGIYELVIAPGGTPKQSIKVTSGQHRLSELLKLI